MSIWKTKATIQDLDELCKHSMVSHLGIIFTDIGEDYIRAKMPVDDRTVQPHGLLHGGASATLAETLGSIAANLCIDNTKKVCVGLGIDASHVRSARNGYVYGTTKPIHIGGSTQIWEIRITDEKNTLICISRLTMAVLSVEERNA
jgi:1,4-dihydroxy-2-naphthoyl-CoA hydrolase